MDIKRNVRLFFVSYGKLLFEILFVIALIILGLQYLNKKVAEPKQVSAQINIENTNNVQNIQQDKNIISTFTRRRKKMVRQFGVVDLVR